METTNITKSPFCENIFIYRLDFLAMQFFTQTIKLESKSKFDI